MKHFYMTKKYITHSGFDGLTTYGFHIKFNTFQDVTVSLTYRTDKIFIH